MSELIEGKAVEVTGYSIMEFVNMMVEIADEEHLNSNSEVVLLTKDGTVLNVLSVYAHDCKLVLDLGKGSDD